jgi:general stress protein 26
VTWFIASRESPKLGEIGTDDHVQIICQDKDTFLSIGGVATIVEDRKKIDELWDERFHAWFPRGKDDPNVVLISVSPIEGEYWDTKGLKGVRYAFEAVKAFIKNVRGKTAQPHITQEQHGKADLR